MRKTKLQKKLERMEQQAPARSAYNHWYRSLRSTDQETHLLYDGAYRQLPGFRAAQKSFIQRPHPTDNGRLMFRSTMRFMARHPRRYDYLFPNRT